MSSRGRAFCFTLNNYTEEDVIALSGVRCEYIIFGFEVGESGTPHLQGYVRFKNPAKFNEVKNKMPKCHIEIAKGSAKQNITYCTKEHVKAAVEGKDLRPFIEVGLRPLCSEKSGLFRQFIETNNEFKCNMDYFFNFD